MNTDHLSLIFFVSLEQIKEVSNLILINGAIYGHW